MSELDSHLVKRGYWVNLSKGPVMGQTITTTSETGTIIVAVLAVISSLGMNHLWHLLTFIYHQIRANGQPKDGLFRHEQAVLRTLPTPSSLAADSLKLWLAWRGVSKNAFARSLLHASTGLLFTAAALAVSIYSSSVVDSTNLEVLVQSPHCAQLNADANIYDNYGAPVLAAAESYAPDCYKNGSLPARCKIFTRPNIPFHREISPCPFEEKMCSTDAVTHDSGFLDVNDAFGLNLPDTDRVRYRRKTTCTLLNQDGYTRLTNASAANLAYGRPPLPDETVLEYTYTDGSKNVGYPDIPEYNYTFAQSLLTSNTSGKFDILAFTQMANSQYNAMTVLPELQRSDADVGLKLILKNSVLFRNPVDDPMFAAHIKVQSVLQGGNGTEYLSDEIGSMLGCATQYQYCIGDSFCSEPGGLLWEGMNNTDFFPGATDLQLAVLWQLSWAGYFSDIVSFKGFDTERRFLSYDNRVETLPDDQWINEIHSWETEAWAIHQIVLSDYAIGPSLRASRPENVTIPLATEADRALCKVQKMQKPGGFVNINFFALLFTLIVSSTIVTVDMLILRILISCRRFRAGFAPRIDRWIQDGIFQLQRRAHEAQGHGTWKDLREDVPVTTHSILLPDLHTETFNVNYSDYRNLFTRAETGMTLVSRGTSDDSMRSKSCGTPAFKELS
ncbi:hypothetical protein M011DRAFT_479365 [Sporormia fimetaria CBS 119925]|uniref:Uncharacterized protein n=1 Tax=Sporormia fimetaria CBS 119925 TaxID=1340428 RepID=A0A6A6V3T2_9PLEO|nr:hypothetical protein M011DRAFT_479365 [Sporormia fimetaria CBS 119925]